MTEEKEIAKAAVKAKIKRVMNKKRWAECEAIWASGDMTLETLAEKYSISTRTIQRHMFEYEVKRGSKASETRKKVAEEIAKAHVEDTAILVARIRETKEEHYKMVSGLGKLTWQEIVNAKTSGVPFAASLPNLKALETAINNIKKVREEKWSLLGLDKEDVSEDEGLPDLIVSELTADQVEQLRSRDHTAFDELPSSDGDNDVGEDDAEDEVEDDGVVDE